MWVLLAVAIVVVGFALRLNAMLVVAVSGIAAGLIERYGLQYQARRLIERLGGLTVGRLLATYLFIRQATAALGLTAIGGPAPAGRPVVAPMAEAAAERAPRG